MLGLVLTIILDLVGHLTDSRTVQRIIDLIEQWLPTILDETRELLPAVLRIIAILKGSDILTPDQAAAVDNLYTQSHAAFEVAALAAVKGA